MAPSVTESLKCQWSVPKYKRPEPTKEDLDWAPLVKIDVSRIDEPGELHRLAQQLNDAVQNVGFWFVTGYGISDAEVMQVLEIMNGFFKLPMAEKVKVPIDLSRDHNWGYREPTRKLGDSGLTESVETYEMHKDISALKDVPLHPYIASHWDVLAPFMKKMHTNIIQPLYRIIATVLELPEDYFVNLNKWVERSEDFFRAMLNPPRSREYHEQSAKFGVGGHKDQSSLTALWPQAVSGLQMRTTDGTWKWVKYEPNCVTINCGELISHMSKGVVKATVHRVTGPPDDQLHENRLGLIYFALFNDNTVIRPVPSPVLERMGLITEADRTEERPTSMEYTRTRMRLRHHVKEFKARDNGSWLIKGIEVKKNYE